ncbi:hypothetical protein SCYAM73S_02796 [Streptomyces cyaneofuscatus]
MASISSRTTLEMLSRTFLPSGSQDQMPAALRRTYPARTSSLWLSVSASAGSSRSVLIINRDMRWTWAMMNSCSQGW